MIKVIREPFPHLIVDNYYNKEELDNLWKVIDSKKDLIPANLLGSTTGNHLANHLDIKDIKEISLSIVTTFEKLSPYHRMLSNCSTKYIKLNYYQNYNHYPSHIDIPRYTAVTFLNKEPKKFEGGDLRFTEFDYTIPFKNNTLVLFTGCFYHEVTLVKLEEFDYLTGNGRYAITQFMDTNAPL